jgi:uncharacterized protein YbcC (UPF0753/DUF2309 family)
MTTATVLDASDRDAHAHDERERLDTLLHAIEHAAHYLPAQGPITVFIHHNTLHAFEEYKFDEGVERGARLFGCEPYLPESRYRELLARGRIRPADIDAVLLDDLGEAADDLLGFMGTRFHFRQAMLRYPLQAAPPAELEWFIAETDALTTFRQDAPEDLRRRFVDETRHWILRDHRNGVDAQASAASESPLQAVLCELIDHFGRGSIDRWSAAKWEAYTLQALWRICELGVSGVSVPVPRATPALRQRDWLLAATGIDTDQLVGEVLIRLCSAFLDQGFSRWSLPERERGLWPAFVAVQSAGGVSDRWLAGLNAELARLAEARLSSQEIIVESLDLLGVSEADWEHFLVRTALALRGWAGMIRQVETRGDRVAHPIPPGSLTDFLAVRLILDRMAISHVARSELGFRGPLRELREHVDGTVRPHEQPSVDERSFQVFQLAQVLGWLPPALAHLAPREWATLVREIEAFPTLARRRVLHAAYERNYRIQTLDAIAIHSQRPAARVANPRFQIMCCLDEREESFRRHLEEIAPDVETFGAAGFFAVPMYYRGAADAHFVPLCPIVIKPQHWVAESVDELHDELGSRRAATRRVVGRATHGMHVGSRSVAGGAVLAAGLGALASIPLVARVLFPRLTAQIRRTFEHWVRPPAATHLELERGEVPPAPQPGHVGYTLEEMTNMGQRLLLDIGLTSSFAPLVLVLGHGSHSLNNPHNSAYNCGACGGSCGGPNARALAQILNDPRVRQRLSQRGLSIPAGTWFVGAWHNTCNDAVTWLDQDRIPALLQDEFRQVCALLDEACDRNAHERCRRFMSAPLTMTPAQARRHVEERSEDLAQTRPECGHASNAVCLIGRRSRTLGLYMDRRTFLTSYDPTQDDAEASTLVRLLGAAVPVCGGINLEYYFSYVDNPGFGCGTKLPHNVTSLLGVMDGAASDLRTGLPWQMVEIHEPVRILFVIETTPETMNRIMDRHPDIGQLCRNGWVQVATLSPDSSRVHVLRGETFEIYRPEATGLPQAATSADWYRGWRDHLPYAQIGSHP